MFDRAISHDEDQTSRARRQPTGVGRSCKKRKKRIKTVELDHSKAKNGPTEKHTQKVFSYLNGAVPADHHDTWGVDAQTMCQHGRRLLEVIGPCATWFKKRAKKTGAHTFWPPKSLKTHVF
jgi:hypothetical protein